MSYDVNMQWDHASEDLRRGAIPDLRQAIAADPKLHVLIVHGWNALFCPFMGSILSVNQLPVRTGLAKQVEVHEFPGGHMFYTRAANGASLHRFAEPMVSTH